MVDRFEVNINHSADILIWDPNCVQVLRDECRIFGKYIGSVARAPHKTTFKGLPLKLGLEELVVLLKEKSSKITLTISTSLISESICESTVESIAEYKAALVENCSEMSKIIIEDKLRKSNLHFDNVAKNQKFAMKRKADLISGSSSPPELHMDNISVHLPTGTPVEWLRKSEKEIIDVPELKTLAENLDFIKNLMQNRLNYELSPELIVKCFVFHNLWSRGFCITISCKKMGGDYLLYSGDPWIYHATHVVRIFASTDEMRPFQWITKLRLINSLKKICLIAWYDKTAIDQSSNTSTIMERLNVTFNVLGWCGIIP